MPDPTDRLIARLDLRSIATDVYEGGAGQGGQGAKGRLFGGLVAAQAFVAAARTAQVGPVHSLHLYFLRPGRLSEPIHFHVDRLKQGRHFEVRGVRAQQGDQLIFQMMASFSANTPGPEHQAPIPKVPTAENLPNRDEVRGKPGWAEQPVDMRTNDPNTEGEDPEHWVWMRSMRPLPEDPILHTAMLVFATDRALLRTATLPHQHRGEFAGASLDHVIWFHDPVDFNGWHLHHMQSPVARHERGLVLGGIYHEDGRRVATTAQEGALRFA